MTNFSYQILETKRGFFKLNFLDLPMICVLGRNHLLIREEASRILNAVISIRIRKGLIIPKPAKALNAITVEDYIDFRLSLYWSLQESGLSLRDFARDMNIDTETVNNIFNGADSGFYPEWVDTIASQDLQKNKGSVDIIALALPQDVGRIQRHWFTG